MLRLKKAIRTPKEKHIGFQSETHKQDLSDKVDDVSAYEASIIPSDSSFHPLTFLVTVHEKSSYATLATGLESLRREVG